MKNDTKVEQKTEREVVITRTFNAPARLVFEAWTKAELMPRWWVPKSSGITLLSCEMAVRTGGTYRFVFKHPVVPGETMAFFGRYVEVTPHSRLVWTNDESGDAGQVSTLTLEDLKGGTFTITNGGVFGSLMSTPILNPPQVGILGLHKIADRAVPVNGQVVIRPMMYLALSYDHRIVDGREAVQFLVKIKDYIEDPAWMLLEG